MTIRPLPILSRYFTVTLRRLYLTLYPNALRSLYGTKQNWWYEVERAGNRQGFKQRLDIREFNLHSTAYVLHVAAVPRVHYSQYISSN